MNNWIDFSWKNTLGMGILFLFSCASTNTNFSTGNFLAGGLVSKIILNSKDEPNLKRKFSNTENSSTANISLLLPFNLFQFSTENTSPNLRGTIETNAVAWDFYQGFRMGIDSVARYNLKHGLKGIDLQVIDSGEDSTSLNQILKGGSLDQSDLIIGPLYPDQIRLVSWYSKAKQKFFVSPLSPQPLSTYQNPQIIMVNNSLEGYAQKTGDFIESHYPTGNVLILDNNPIDKAFYGPMLNHFIYPPKVIHLELNEIKEDNIPISPDLPNILIVPSMDKSFWAKLEVFLSNYKPPYQIVVFAHPNFPRLNLMDRDLLQNLHLHYPSNFYSDPDDSYSQAIINEYKILFNSSPTNNALLGYDIAQYFGSLVSSNNKFPNALSIPWKGVHNDFNFLKLPGIGYQNQSIKMMQFSNGLLKEEF